MFQEGAVEGGLPDGMNRIGLTIMHLVRRHETDPGVMVVLVVPAEELAAERRQNGLRTFVDGVLERISRRRCLLMPHFSREFQTRTRHGVSLLREALAGFHPPRYAALLNQPSPRFGHSSGRRRATVRRMPRSRTVHSDPTVLASACMRDRTATADRAAD